MKYILIFLFITAFNFNSKAQIITPDSLLFKIDKQSMSINKNVFTRKNILIFGLGLGTSFILDTKLNKFTRDNKSTFMNSYTDVSTYFGEKTIIAPATLVTWAIGKAIHNDELSTTSLNSAKALFCGAILTESIKFIAGRDRPDERNGNMEFNFLGGNTNQHKSMPSGHSFVAWAAFTPFAEQYSKWIYIIPASVSISRMYRNRHWFSDVFLGAGIGYFAGLYFHNRKQQKILFNANGLIIKF